MLYCMAPSISKNTDFAASSAGTMKVFRYQATPGDGRRPMLLLILSE